MEFRRTGEAATILGCEIGKGDLSYLGMRIGQNHHKNECWEWLGWVNSNSKIPWVSWNELSSELKERGLGFKDVGLFKQALVGKWIWRFLEKGDRLWVNVIRSRYDGLEWVKKLGGTRGGYKGGSTWWRDICDLYWGKKGGGWGGLNIDFTKVVGGGDNTQFWLDY
ncbi:hypothetical protein ACS0TY_007511 [Phlomoides rotata]